MKDSQSSLFEGLTDTLSIVTWNANRAFYKKIDHLVASYNPDLIIIQECEKDCSFCIEKFPYQLWEGENEKQGITILSKLPITQPTKPKISAKFFIPFTINNILILAFWTKDDKEEPAKRYIGQVYSVINSYRKKLNSKIIILGDFNWNVCWDKNERSPVCGTLTELIALFDLFNIHSIYHDYYKQSFGIEKDPTLYLRKNIDLKYHVDYVFASDTLQISDFIIGEYADWIKYSDHMPISFDLHM